MFVKVHHIPTPPAGGLLIYRGGKARERKEHRQIFPPPHFLGLLLSHSDFPRGKLRRHKHRPPKTIEREGRVALQYGNQWTSPCSFCVVVICWWLGHSLLYGFLGRSCSCCWLRRSWDFFVSVLGEHRREGRDLICNSREHDWFAFWVFSLASNDSPSMHRAFTFCKTFPPNIHANENFPLFHVFRLLISLRLHFALDFHCLFH